MARAYLIMKKYSRAWGIAYPKLHEAHMTRKAANAACKALNAKAQNYEFWVESVTLVETK